MHPLSFRRTTMPVWGGICALVFGGAVAHVQMITPMPRSAADRNLPPWRGGKFGNNTCERTPPQGTCWGGDCQNATQPCEVGQSFLWFNQGCSIGCAECDGGPSNPNTRDRCGSGMKPTNNDPRFWGLNRGVTPMGPEDTYQHNPWRAPGNAPVHGACGMAGGALQRDATGSPYVDTVFAKQGDPGAVLPSNPTGIKWPSGGVAEAKLSVRANHGGGYQYRLCAATRPLTEACLQQTPLDFTRRAWLEFRNGSRLEVNGTYLSEGTSPPNSTWALNPFPFGSVQKYGSFEPPCRGEDDRANSTDPQPHQQLCEGVFPFGVNVIDELRVPPVPPGEYVLGLRYDSEMTAQVWQQCADITIDGGGERPADGAPVKGRVTGLHS
jgi:lytic starch monooxygenase